MKLTSIIALVALAVASVSVSGVDGQSIPQCPGDAYTKIAESANAQQCSQETSIDFYRLVPAKTSGCKSEACKAVVKAFTAAFPTDCKIDARRYDATVFGTLVSSLVKDCPEWLKVAPTTGQPSSTTAPPIAISPPRNATASPSPSMSATTGSPVATSAPRWATAPPTSSPPASLPPAATGAPPSTNNTAAPEPKAPAQQPQTPAPASTEQPQPQTQPEPQPAVKPTQAAPKPTPTQKSSSATTALAVSVPAVAVLATMLA